MEDNVSYKFIGKMALEFRLSLYNICKLFGRPTTEEFKMYFYENIRQTTVNDVALEERYKYLFFYETINESSKASLVSYTAAKNFIERYGKARKEGNEEKLRKIKEELYKTDNDMKELERRIYDQKLTPEDIAIISRYRVKYVVSRTAFGEAYNISDRTIETAEKRLSSNILKDKIHMLSDYYSNLRNQRMRKHS
ncbi:MAG: hypothetical protein IJY25_03200 [Bacilli bacterium]|nr:hypothetical protein [Bacilli bacterium]